MTSPGPGALLARAVVLGLVAASLLPIPNWIPSERSAPWYHEALGGWVLGTVVVVLAGAGLAWLSSRLPPLWREGAVGAALARLDPARGRSLAAVKARCLVRSLAEEQVQAP